LSNALLASVPFELRCHEIHFGNCAVSCYVFKSLDIFEFPVRQYVNYRKIRGHNTLLLITDCIDVANLPTHRFVEFALSVVARASPPTEL
jgi:hypothetical protein